MAVQVLTTEQERRAVKLLGLGLAPARVAAALLNLAPSSSGSNKELAEQVGKMIARMQAKKVPIERRRTFGGFEGVEPLYTPTPPAQVMKHFNLLLDRVEGWTDESAWEPGLILYGPLGRGKSGAAIHLARFFNSLTGWSCQVEKLWRILARMKAANIRDRGEIAEHEIVEEYSKPELLIVDEAGVNPGTDSDHRIIYEVLDTRYERMKWTIITTNHELDDKDSVAAAAEGRICGVDMFLRHFGTRTADRFQGSKVRIDGMNLRAR